MDCLEWKTLLRWMIWGVPYVWRHPFGIFCVYLILMEFGCKIPVNQFPLILRTAIQAVSDLTPSPSWRRPLKR